jgi:hypothetical protein
MPLRILTKNATSEEISRGLAAAEAVFGSSGISHEDAMGGVLAVELWEMKGFPEEAEPDEEEQLAAKIWFQADSAAWEACCAGWPEDEVVRNGILGVGAEPKVKTANLTTWAERQRLYPRIIARLEAATGPDRQLDLDICYVMGWVNEPGTPEKAAELELPYLTGNLAEVAEIAEKSLQGWTIQIDQVPCDARIIDPKPDYDDDDYDGDRSVAAWRALDGRLYMEKPPANTAIALTLAALRLQADSFFEPAG